MHSKPSLFPLSLFPVSLFYLSLFPLPSPSSLSPSSLSPSSLSPSSPPLPPHPFPLLSSSSTTPKALTEERKMYCFVVDHFCSVIHNQIRYNAMVNMALAHVHHLCLLLVTVFPPLHSFHFQSLPASF